MKYIPVFLWFDKSTLLHLRLPFSFFLMPVFMFALSNADHIDWPDTLLAFFILHLFVFPSSNGYNSYQDRDESSIGILKNPPKVTYNLFYVTLLLDIIAVVSGLLISLTFSLLVLTFILVSRAYSYRGIRLKKFAFRGFLTVFVFQGAFVFLTASTAISGYRGMEYFSFENLLCMGISSLFIGSIYPLTQIYQHEADKKDGVISISYKLGYTGTFIFSAILFIIGTIFLYYYFLFNDQRLKIVLFLVIMAPVISRMFTWFNAVRKDKLSANFENTMAMNLLTSICMNVYFLVLILNNHFTWF